MADLSGEHLGRYRLIERLGEGGMATVYRAYDTRLEREVAVKIIRSTAFPPEILDQILARFDREAKSLAKLSHPNIVKVYDYGEHGGSPYLVMEYLPGGTLKKFLGKPLPWQNALSLLFPVVRGVIYAHQRGILHRDIKPANILITEDGEPMLSDFGIAKIFLVDQATTLTGSGTVIGTPGYMAPEQWDGITSPKSDQYSLGVVLYEMVAGRKPFVADTPAGILLRQATEPLPSPRKFVTDLPEELELVLIKTLTKDPEDRYQDLNTFSDTLKNIYASATVVRPKPDQTEKTHAASSGKQVLPPTQRMEEDNLAKQQAENEAAAKAQAETERRPKEQTDRAAGQKTVPRGLIFGITVVMLLMIAGIGLRTFFIPGETVTQTPTNPITGAPKTQASTIVPRTLTSNPPVFIASPEMKVGSSYSYIDGSVLAAVPAGSFTMGAGKEDNPKHQVTLAGYWIFSTEVTNQQYALCVSLGKCTAPDADDNPGYLDYKLTNNPVTGVTYEQASNYCKFVNGRLPSEAEWEKAAQSSNGGKYPWGDTAPSCNLLNYNHCLAGMANVIDYKEGASQYGALNMSGNAFEWVADWYDANYYTSSPAENPAGPSSGTLRSVRSSSYESKLNEVALAIRNSESPQNHRPDLGFRCVVDDPTYFAPFCESPLIYDIPIARDPTALETCPDLEIKPVEVCNGSTPQSNITFVGPPDAEIDAQGCTQFNTDPIRYACTSRGKIVSMTGACQLNDPGKFSCLSGYLEQDSVCVADERERIALNCLAGDYDPTRQCCINPQGHTDSEAVLKTCPVGMFYAAKANVCLPQPVQEVVKVSYEVSLPACAAGKGGGGKGSSGSTTGGNTGGCNATQAQINNCNSQAPYYSWNSSTCSCEPAN